MNNGESATARDIEQDIRRTQASLDRVLDALETKLEPRNLVFDVVTSLWRTGTRRGNVGRMGDAIRRSPVPAVLMAVAGAWVAVDAVRRREPSDEEHWRASQVPPVTGVTMGPARTDPAATTIYEADRTGTVRPKSAAGVHPSPQAPEPPPSPTPETVIGAQHSEKSAAASSEVLQKSAEDEAPAAASRPDTVLVRPDGSPLAEETERARTERPQGAGTRPGK